MKDLMDYRLFEELEVLAKKYPNDMELGAETRKMFSDVEFVKNTPNDDSLGKEIRWRVYIKDEIK